MSRRVAKGVIALILLAAVAAVYFSPLRDHLNREEIRGFVAQLRGVWYGPIAFIAIFAVGCVFALPATIFVLAAGVIWGWVFGGTYSIIGGIIGAVVSFYVGRFIGEGILQRFGRLGEIVRKQVDHAGFKSLLLLRFVPGIPFPVLNYGAGVCGVRVRDFVAATLLGMSPSIYVFSYCADALFNGTMSEGEAVRRLVIVAVLMIAIVLIPGLLKRRMAQPAQPKT